MIEIIINNKKYQVKEAHTDEELKQGLKGIKSLPENEGMLFYMKDQLQQQIFTMVGVKIPLDIIFINQDDEVVDVCKNCQPNQETVINNTKYLDDDDYIAYVLEVNINSNIKIGDELNTEDTDPVMKVLFPDGSEQMALWGGERIVSRRETRILIKKAKKASVSKSDIDYKALGKYIFKVFKRQDERSPEYVQNPS